jgi:hypothetical protein
MESVQRKDPGQVIVLVHGKNLESSRTKGTPPCGDPPGPQKWDGFRSLRQALPLADKRAYALLDPNGGRHRPGELAAKSPRVRSFPRYACHRSRAYE